MTQLTLFDDIGEKKAVNVAAVPQRSPFRYPGGKTWLIPYIRIWLKSISPIDNLIEPFAGGAIVSLTAVAERLVDQVLMVEKDEDIAAVWQTILKNDARWLAEKIYDFEFTKDNIKKILTLEHPSIKNRAFATILKNRLNRSGILAYGAGMVKKGENGKGLKSRWYPETLKKRILAIDEFKDSIDFIQGDGLDVIKKYINDTQAAFFIDPPYTVAGKRLYKYFQINHRALFGIVAKAKGDFLLTYDESDEIEDLAYSHNFEVERILMKTSHHLKKYEMLIGRNLNWFRQAEV